jgi:hypothetical protein
MPEIQIEPPFSLSTEALDSLRLDAQAVSPEKAKEFQAVVVEAYEIFLKKFEKLFSQRETIPAELMKDRFILVDKATIGMFMNTWEVQVNQEYSDGDVLEKLTKPYTDFLVRNNYPLEPTSQTLQSWLDSLGEDERSIVEDIGRQRQERKGSTYIAEGETGTFRAYHREGHFLVGIPIELWESLESENQRELVGQHGSLEKAKEFVDRAAWLNLILHELTHLHQKDSDTSIPLWLKELQAYWVGRELAEPDSQLHKPDFDQRADFFQSLLDKYPDLHQVLLELNQGYNQFTLYSVLKEVPEEKVRELFPDYRDK